MSFFYELVGETAAGQATLAAVPQIQAGLAGRISLRVYVDYLAQAYHHVRHTVPLMRAAQARLDNRHSVFVAALDDYVVEETGHEEWILDDVRNCGADPDAVRRSAPKQSTRAMVDYVYDYIERVNPMGFFGMVFVLEGTSTRLATQGAAAVAESLDLGPECFRYLTSHGEVDRNHMVFFQKLMDQIDGSADQAAIIEVARAVFDLFADVFRSIPLVEEEAHVVQG